MNFKSQTEGQLQLELKSRNYVLNGRALLVCQDAILKPSQAPRTVGVREIFASCRQNPEMKVMTIMPRAICTELSSGSIQFAPS